MIYIATFLVEIGLDTIQHIQTPMGLVHIGIGCILGLLKSL